MLWDSTNERSSGKHTLFVTPLFLETKPEGSSGALPRTGKCAPFLFREARSCGLVLAEHPCSGLRTPEACIFTICISWETAIQGIGQVHLLTSHKRSGWRLRTNSWASPTWLADPGMTLPVGYGLPLIVAYP